MAAPLNSGAGVSRRRFRFSPKVVKVIFLSLLLSFLDQPTKAENGLLLV